MLELTWEEELPGVGGNRRRVGDIEESTGLVIVSETEGVGYENPAAQNEDPIHLIQDIYVRLGGTGGGLRGLTVEGEETSFKLSSA
jgi:hypothetical protein